jgi:hypothetical protein
MILKYIISIITNINMIDAFNDLEKWIQYIWSILFFNSTTKKLLNNKYEFLY